MQRAAGGHFYVNAPTCSVVGAVGEGVGAGEPDVRRIGEGAVAIEGERAVQGGAGQNGGQPTSGIVGEHALRAIAELSRKTEKPFVPAPVAGQDPDEAKAKNVAAAKAWYARNKAKLPKAEPAPAAKAEPAGE